MLEEIRSELETEVQKLEKQVKLEDLPSDTEHLTKVHIHTVCSCVGVWVCFLPLCARCLVVPALPDSGLCKDFAGDKFC